MNNRGIILAFEGLDGSGKETQTKLLEKRLNENNIKSIRIEFPNYNGEYSIFVKKYLNGEFGEDLNPYVISTFFSLDRLGVYKTYIEKYIKEGNVVICDRYVYSNLIYQGGKISDLSEREKFFNWILDFEYNKCSLLKEERTFFLDVPIDISLKIIKERETHDIHEKNEKFLRSCYENLKYISKKYNLEIIECFKNEKLLSIEEINDDIYKRVLRILNLEV